MPASAITQATGSATGSVTAFSLVTGTTTQVGTTSQNRSRLLDGWIDFSTLAVGGADVYKIDVVDASIGTGTPSAIILATYHVNTPQVWELGAHLGFQLIALNYTDILVTKVSGTDRTLPYALRETKHADDGTWGEVIRSNTIASTEYSVPNNSTVLTAQTDDAYIQIWAHYLLATVNARLRVRVYDKLNAGTQRVRTSWDLYRDELFISPIFLVMDGWDVTVERISGAAETFDINLRKFIPPLTGGGAGGYSRARLVNG